MKKNSDDTGVLVRTPSERIVADLRQRIIDGRLRPGDRLPSARAITREWGVAIATATKVLAALRSEGLVTAVAGIGTIVAERPERAGTDALSRELIVRTAIRIADEVGLAALSMRRVGNELGVATMSLYRHVSGKDELVLLMIDQALGEERLPAKSPKGWRPALEIAGRLLWTVFRRHPWVAGAMTVSRPQLLPNAMPLGNWVLAALDRIHLGGTQRLYVHVSLFSFVRGVALTAETEVDAEQETGVDADRWMAQQLPMMREAVAAGEFDALTAIMEEDLEFDLDHLFEFGLNRFLDGIEQWLRK